MSEIKILTQQEIERYYAKCEFDDECDVCDSPEHGSYAVGYSNTEAGADIDSYICGKCASKNIPILDAGLEQDAKHWDEIGKQMDAERKAMPTAETPETATPKYQQV